MHLLIWTDDNGDDENVAVSNDIASLKAHAEELVPDIAEEYEFGVGYTEVEVEWDDGVNTTGIVDGEDIFRIERIDVI